MPPLPSRILFFKIRGLAGLIPYGASDYYFADSVFIIKTAHRTLLERRWTFLVQASDDVTSTFIDIG